MMRDKYIDVDSVDSVIEEVGQESKIANVAESVLAVMAAGVLWTVTMLLIDYVGIAVFAIMAALTITASAMAIYQVEHTYRVFRMLKE